MRALGLGLSVAAMAMSIAACSASKVDERTASNDSAIRDLNPEEILGEIQYGETKEVDLTTTPTYRAFWFHGERGDQIQMTATALDATDPIMWFADDHFNTLAMNNDARPTDTSSLISGRYLPYSGTFFVIFRDIYKSPRAKFAVAIRKLGVLPLECDPDGEGTFDSSCTDPLGYDPFQASSCTGDDLPVDKAKTLFGANGGFKPALARVYYRTRQCIDKGGDQAGQAAPDCSAWVYAFAMDVKLATIAPKEGAEGTWTFASDSTRKSKIDFTLAPSASLKQACVDGPFAAGPLSTVRGETWSMFPDGSAGVCTTALADLPGKMTSTCARFELPSIRLGSGEATHYTELSPVLHAKF